MTIAIIGLGVIGGSLAKALKAKTTHTILGFDKNKVSVEQAYHDGAIDDVCTGFDNIDIVFLALSPKETIDFVNSTKHNFKPDTFYIDLCGVKRNVIESIAGLFPARANYISGNPLVECPKAGFENSDADLFQDCTMILTPDENLSISDSSTICALFLEIGFAGVELATDSGHDELIAYTSQLPSIVSSAYIKSSLANKVGGFSVNYYNDIVKTVPENSKLWSELLIYNKDNLVEGIADLILNLTDIRNALLSNNEPEIQKLLDEAVQIKQNINTSDEKES